MAEITVPDPAELIISGPKLSSPAQVNRSVWTGRRKVVGLAGTQVWQASIAIADIATEEAERPWRAFLFGLEGPQNHFRLPLPCNSHIGSKPLVNANRVPLSVMEGDSGWRVVFNPADLAISPAYGDFNGFRFFRANPTATASDQLVVISHTAHPASAFSALPGERLSVQARIDAFGPVGSWYLAIQFVRADASTTFEAVASGTGESFLSAVRSGFVDVPSGGSPVVGAYIEIGMESNAAGAIVFAVSEPMVTSAQPGQTVHPPFAPGPGSSDANTLPLDGMQPDALILPAGSFMTVPLPSGHARAVCLTADLRTNSGGQATATFKPELGEIPANNAVVETATPYIPMSPTEPLMGLDIAQGISGTAFDVEEAL
jgi:hypothetical protein